MEWCQIAKKQPTIEWQTNQFLWKWEAGPQMFGSGFQAGVKSTLASYIFDPKVLERSKRDSTTQ